MTGSVVTMSELTTRGWPHRLLTLDDWNALPEDESHQVECAEGVLIVTPKPWPRHQVGMGNLFGLLRDVLPEHLVAVPDLDVLVEADPLTVREPDVVVAHRDVVRTAKPPLDAEAVVLVVEIISPGSRRTDRVLKLSEYADAGIAEYWILDLDPPATLTVHRLGPDGGYRQAAEHRGRATIEAFGSACEIELDELGRI